MAENILGTNVASAIVPFTTDDAFATHDALYGKGGWRSVETIEERDAITDQRKTVGMAVYVVGVGSTYIWNESGWTLYQPGGGGGGGSFQRDYLNHVVEALPPEASVSFELEMGKSSLVYRLSVDRPVKVTAWSTPAKDEPNPYIFLATADHLTDDGSTLLSDGTILKSRQYSIFVNLESPPLNKIYFDIASVDSADGPVTLSLTYMTVE